MPRTPPPTAIPDAPPQLRDVAAVARRLGISTKSVRRAIAAGELTAHRLGRLLRVADADLEAYLAKRRLVR
jgi:excisionase family DNA binding protein